MAGKKTKEKIGFKDLVTFAKAGWTPEETNALLDRLESMGDPNEPDVDDSADDEDDDPEDDAADEDEEDDDAADDADEDNEDDDAADDVDDNLKKLEKTGNEILKNENERLKKELSKLKAKNRSKDVSSGNNTKSCEDKLIDIFQDCVS